ncbi:MAG: RING finger protein, partial [Oscillospiraceae bacterium]|nr:RING finger protein [Oscillospiraceae bacterium]
MVTMFFYEGYVCPVCRKKFQEQEDIVACPDCGAPHHRSCWNQGGQCSYAEDHGTSRQWKRPEETSARPTYSDVSFDGSEQARTCSRCGKVNPEYAEFCARCGLGLKPPEWKSDVPNNNYAGSQY